MGGIQKENFEGDEGQVLEDNITDDGRLTKDTFQSRSGYGRSRDGGRLCWWRNGSVWEMREDSMNVSRWAHQWRFHNRSVMWDTPLAKRVGEGKDWIQEMDRKTSWEG